MINLCISKRSKTRKVLLSVLVLISIMVALLAPQAAYAKTESSDPADSLKVYLVDGKETKLIHDYSYEDMEALADGKCVSYSSIDAYPICVYTLSNGVYLDTLIKDAKKRTNIPFEDWSKIKLYATDNWVSTYTKDFLYGKKRYYFPELFTTWDVEYQEPGDGADENPEESEPMFAITSFQTRIFDNSNPKKNIDKYEREMNAIESFRFCMGMTKKDLTSKTSTTAKYGRWVNRMDIIVPSSEGEKEDTYTSVTGLNLNMETAEVKEGNTVQLTAKIIPDDATDKGVTWSSDDSKIAKVGKDGLVTGVCAGTTTITATAADNKKVKKSCTVTVTENHVDVTGITLDDSSITLVAGKTKKLSPIIKPYNATNTNISWDSDNTAVASVDTNGLINAKTPGTARITATTEEGGFTVRCNVKVVVAEVPITKIKLNTDSCTLKIDETKQLKATITPSNATNSDIFWSSDKASVATVNTNGLVTAKREGKATIKAMTEDGSVSDSCIVTVLKKGETPSPGANQGTTPPSNTKPGETPVNQGTPPNADQNVANTGTTPTAAFNDTANSWAKKNIEQMVEFGVLSGYQDGSFKPNKTVTRAEFVTMVVKTLEKLNQVNHNSGIVFGDTANSWAKDYISTAVSHGFVKGYSDSAFGPDDKITREQMAAIIVRAFNLPPAALQTGFADEAKISSWAKDVVAAAVESKVMTGTTGNRFAPEDKATRAEAATVLLRLLQFKGHM